MRHHPHPNANPAPAPRRDVQIHTDDKPAIMGEIQRRGAIAQYNHFFTGRTGLWGMLRYELTTSTLQSLPGALGYLLRGKLYRSLLAPQGRGRGINWGLGVCLRHPGKIALGDHTAIDDHVLLCARGAPDHTQPTFSIGPDSLIGRFTVIQSKRGTLHIGKRAQIGTHCQIQSANDIQIGDHFITGPQCYLGGSRHGIALNADDAHGQPNTPAPPILDQPTYTRGPLTIGHDVWLGAGVRIMEGLTIGHGAVVGTGAVVTRDIPDYAIVAGVPAKIVGYRGPSQAIQPTPPRTAHPPQAENAAA